MSLTFTKLFSSITESTVWCEPAATRLVWITMLAMADRKGRVWASVPGLANRARVSLEDTETALGTLLAPDRYSRTPDFEGRRIEPIDGGWRLINYEKYRERQSDQPGGNPTSRSTKGKVYFIQCAESIKIGFSQNPWARVAALKTGMPSEPKLLGYFPGTMEDEQNLHAKFAEFRIGREWFKASKELIEFVATNCTTGSECSEKVAGYHELQQEAEAEADSNTKAKTKVAPLALPAWLDAETWNAYVKTRPSSARKPDSLKAALQKLEAFRAAGHDANEIVANSLANGWRMLKEPEAKRGQPVAIAKPAIPCGNCARPITGAWSQSPKGRVCDPCYRGYMGRGWPEAA